MLGIAAAAKIKNDMVKEKKAKAAERQAKEVARGMAAKERAMQRMRQRVQAKYDQNSEFKKFKESLGSNQAPEELKRIAFEAYKNAPKVSVGGKEVDFFKLSPEAQAAIKGRSK